MFTNEPSGELQNKGPSPHPTMPDIIITSQGVENLLGGTHEASGSDAISALFLKRPVTSLLPSSRQ